MPPEQGPVPQSFELPKKVPLPVIDPLEFSVPPPIMVEPFPPETLPFTVTLPFYYYSCAVITVI